MILPLESVERMLIQRESQRLTVEIPVAITTVLESLDGVLVDLSAQGAQILGCALPRGTRFQFEYMGQTIFAQCMWSEIDRMGVKFAFPLAEGPLYDRLVVIPRSTGITGLLRSEPAPEPLVRSSAPTRVFGRAPVAAFGRRAGN
ncbi:MAG TPA: PilZ domain-containing protein [Croceibacterium sp.]|nr:PilZ domain-containing protein [Croceibacterium sp.]